MNMKYKYLSGKSVKQYENKDQEAIIWVDGSLFIYNINIIDAKDSI